MNTAQFSRLKPFLKGTSYKTKIFLYLLAEGVPPIEICRMSLGECMEKRSSMSIPDEINLCFDQLHTNHSGGEDEPAFTYPNGRKYSVGDIEKILIRAYGVAGVDYKGIRAYVDFISKGSQNKEK